MKSLIKINENNKIFRNILTIILLVSLIISGILIGSPIEQTHRPIIIITLGLCALYMFLSKEKIKIIRNKIDIFIIILGISTLIPLIFNTAITITGAVNYIYKYVSAILLYICIREHLIKYPETKKAIINCVIFISILLIILGIDNITTKIFTKPLSLLNIEIKEIEENRLSSSFTYANTLAIVVAISLILNNFNYLEEKNKIKKSIYGVINIFLTIGMLLTYSRLVMFSYVIFLILYVFLLKNKLKNYDLIKLLVITIIVSLLYNYIYYLLINSEKYIIMWLSTVVMILLSFGIVYYSIGLEKKLEKFKIKNILIIFGMILLISIVAIICVKGNLDVFKNGRKQYEIQLGNIESGEEYTMDFDIKEINVDNDKNNFTIEIIEMNNYTDEIKNSKIDEKEFLETHQIKIKMQSTTKIVKIIFTKLNDDCKIIINKLTINGKNKVLDYKLLPDEIEHRIENTIMTQNGLYERIVFIEDGLKCLKDNLIFGKGGNAWQFEQYNYAQYFYIATQMHSYILQVGIEYGIVGLIGILGIIVIVLYKYIKSKEKHNPLNVTIIVAILLLLAHSCIDFEMTFLYVLQIFFVLLAIFSSDSTGDIKTSNRYINYLYSSIAIILVLIYIILRPYYDSSVILEKIDELTNIECNTKEEYINIYKQIINQYEKFFKLERDSNNYEKDYYNYAYLVLIDYTEGKEEETLEKLKFVYEASQRMNTKYNIEAILFKTNRCKIIADRMKSLKTNNAEIHELRKQYYQLVIDDVEKTKNDLNANYKLYKLSELQKKYTIQLLETFQKSARVSLEGL